MHVVTGFFRSWSLWQERSGDVTRIEQGGGPAGSPIRQQENSIVKLSTLIASGIVTALASAPVAALAGEADAQAQAEIVSLNVAMIGADGQTLGMAKLEPTPAGVLISVTAKGISEGEHAIHIHEKGVCDAAGGFASAGGHFAPGGTKHGFKDAMGPHAGDMPNQFAGAGGDLRAQMLNRSVTLGETGEGALFDADGSALVIHGGADDYASQPSGAAGPRVACAVIAPPKE
jgi:Cu-Zn family superoxide dismutase